MGYFFNSWQKGPHKKAKHLILSTESDGREGVNMDPKKFKLESYLSNDAWLIRKWQNVVINVEQKGLFGRVGLINLQIHTIQGPSLSLTCFPFFSFSPSSPATFEESKLKVCSLSLSLSLSLDLSALYNP